MFNGVRDRQRTLGFVIPNGLQPKRYSHCEGSDEKRQALLRLHPGQHQRGALHWRDRIPNVSNTKAADTPSFTQKYRVNRLVYFETFQYVNNAIARETELKDWRRARKVELIEKDNPDWEDLASDWGKPAVMKTRFLRSDVAAE